MQISSCDFFAANDLSTARDILDVLAEERYLPREEVDEAYHIYVKKCRREELTEDERDRGRYLFAMVESASARRRGAGTILCRVNDQYFPSYISSLLSRSQNC
jgi:hypothetical protein